MKRSVCMLLCLLMLLPVLSFGAEAKDGTELGLSVLRGRLAPEVIELPPEPVSEEAISLNENAPAEAPLEASGNQGYWYSLLTTRQKEIYNKVMACSVDTLVNKAKRNSKGELVAQLDLNITGMTGALIGGKVSGGSFVKNAAGQKTWQTFLSDLVAVITILKYEHPEYLHFERVAYSYSYIYQEKAGGAKVQNIILQFYLTMDGRELNYYNALMTSAKNIAAQAAKQPDRYKKVKYIHDVLCENNTYNYDHYYQYDGAAHTTWQSKMPHIAYSALIFKDGYEPVCEGYATAFKIICDLLNIPCVIAVSDTHAWNNVQMDDGLWYNLDATWDDQAQGYSHDYFLVGSQTVIRGKPFSTDNSHVETGLYESVREVNPNLGLLAMPALKYPTKCTKAYVYIGRDYPAPKFPDVPRGTWYFDAVEQAADLGLFSGDNTGRFNPSKNITRAEFAAVLANCYKAELASYRGASFWDVKATAWYAPAVAWVKEMGYMSGDPDGNFRPNSPITRQEMCVVLRNALNITFERETKFKDHELISAWAVDAVYSCKANGLVSGTNTGDFNPRKNTTRAEAASVFNKAVVMMR